MPRKGQKQEGATPRNPRRRGAPDPRTVVEEIPFTTPSGKTMIILRTNQMDAYDPPPEEEKGRAKKAKRTTKKAATTKKAGRRRQRG